MSPPLITTHQWLQTILSAEIVSRVRKYARVLAPSDTYFETLQSALQPDILVILNQNLHVIRDDGIYGAPDLIENPISRATTSWALQNSEYREKYTSKTGLFKSKLLDIEFDFNYK